MKKFEATWRDGFTFYERYFDEDLGRSFKKKINLPYEWFEESSRGIYSSILDENIKLEKKQGNAKQGRDNFGFLDPMYRNIRDNYWESGNFNYDPRIWYLDIETRAERGFPVPEEAPESISMFQIFDNKMETVIILGLRDWKHQSDYELEYPVRYITCTDEVHLIETFLALFAKVDPLIIYAWNGMGFDFPYIHNRMKKLGMDVNRLSNYGKVSYSENEYQGKIEFNFTSNGHFFLDLMEVYKKFVFEPMPEYKLDVIAEIEIGENKVAHPEYAKFDDFYAGKYIIPDDPTDEQKASKIYQEAIKNGINEEVRELAHSEFCYYGYKDPLLIYKIDMKRNFTTLMSMISAKMGVQIGDSMGTVKPWSQYIANKSMKDMKVMPPRQENEHPNVVGGYVRDPVLGKQKWVISADVNSMYPLLGMVGFNMSPETFIPIHKLPGDLRAIVLSYFNDQEEEGRLNLDESIWEETTRLLVENNMSLGINGAVFTKDHLGMVPEMVQEIYDSRKQAKNKMFEYERQKLLIEKILKEKVA